MEMSYLIQIAEAVGEKQYGLVKQISAEALATVAEKLFSHVINTTLEADLPIVLGVMRSVSRTLENTLNKEGKDFVQIFDEMCTSAAVLVDVRKIKEC